MQNGGLHEVRPGESNLNLCGRRNDASNDIGCPGHPVSTIVECSQQSAICCFPPQSLTLGGSCRVPRGYASVMAVGESAEQMAAPRQSSRGASARHTVEANGAAKPVAATGSRGVGVCARRMEEGDDATTRAATSRHTAKGSARRMVVGDGVPTNIVPNWPVTRVSSVGHAGKSIPSLRVAKRPSRPNRGDRRREPPSWCQGSRVVS